MPRSSGFTPLELLMVAANLGLLATLAATHVTNSRQGRLAGLMETELRRLAVAQQSYAYDHGIYAADPARLRSRGLAPAPGVSLTVHEATVAGWSASARHTGTGVSCHLFIGAAAPVGTATAEGTVRCG